MHGHRKHFPIGIKWYFQKCYAKNEILFKDKHDHLYDSAVDKENQQYNPDNESETLIPIENETRSPKFTPVINNLIHHKFPTFILLLTFVIYTGYHASRRPISVVKSVLHHPSNCSSFVTLSPSSDNPTPYPYANNSLCVDWPPFDGPNYNRLFGALDMAYLFSYAIAMFVSGHLAEHSHLRYFLTFGMILSGLSTVVFGAGYFFNIHSILFYFGIQIIGGIFQSSGWPSVVTCMGYWFGKRKKGLIFGIWNSHTSVGNILGSLLASIWVNYAWGWSFVVPGALLILLSGVVWMFLIPSPEEFEEALVIHCAKNRQEPNNFARVLNADNYQKNKDHTPVMEHAEIATLFATHKSLNGNAKQHTSNRHHSNNGISESYIAETDGDGFVNERSHLLRTRSTDNIGNHASYAGPSHTPMPFLAKKPIGIGNALRVPGVLEFSCCLFFAKAVSYTFLYWLPNYITASSDLDPAQAAKLASVFDFGGILGGIIAGYISDKTEASATVCALMLGLSCPLIYYYHIYGHIDFTINVILLFITGLFVNGPYALITTAVSADLGNKIGKSQHAKALATITAIIDGSGSLGAALGPLIAGLVASDSWWNVFAMLIISDIFAIIFLIRLSFREMKLAYQLQKERIV